MTLILQSSMSCKYNSPDNGMIESFFGILKNPDIDAWLSE